MLRTTAPPSAELWCAVCVRLLAMNRAGQIAGLRINGGKIELGTRDEIAVWHWRRISFDQARVLAGPAVLRMPPTSEPWQQRHAECAARRAG